MWTSQIVIVTCNCRTSQSNNLTHFDLGLPLDVGTWLQGVSYISLYFIALNILLVFRRLGLKVHKICPSTFGHVFGTGRPQRRFNGQTLRSLLESDTFNFCFLAACWSLSDCAYITDPTTWKWYIVSASWLWLAVALSLHVVFGPPVGLRGLQVVWEQDLNREADSFGLENTVSVVKSQNICGRQTEQYLLSDWIRSKAAYWERVYAESQRSLTDSWALTGQWSVLGH